MSAERDLRMGVLFATVFPWLQYNSRSKLCCRHRQLLRKFFSQSGSFSPSRHKHCIFDHDCRRGDRFFQVTRIRAIVDVISSRLGSCLC